MTLGPGFRGINIVNFSHSRVCHPFYNFIREECTDIIVFAFGLKPLLLVITNKKVQGL